MRSPKEYVESGDHLPGFMKDFHDQKDLFKTIEMLQGRYRAHGEEISWVDAQIYVIDHFLWFMAQRGYTLQKSRAKVDFKDMSNDIRKMEAASRVELRSLLDDG